MIEQEIFAKAVSRSDGGIAVFVWTEDHFYPDEEPVKHPEEIVVDLTAFIHGDVEVDGDRISSDTVTCRSQITLSPAFPSSTRAKFIIKSYTGEPNVMVVAVHNYRPCGQITLMINPDTLED